MNKVKGKLNPPKVLIFGFATIILIGALLLTLPIATVDGKGLSFLNALFTSTSATCVTGLVVVDTANTFTMFGELVILSLIQVGGLGFMTFATFILILLGKKITLKGSLLLNESLDNTSTEDLASLVKIILIFTAAIEITGAFILSFRFSLDMPIGEAIYFGVFHAISSFNSAGFDLMGDFRSLTPYAEDPIIVLTVSALITLGGLGFIVINEIYQYRETRRLSVHSKVVLMMTLILTLGGAILIFIFEFGNPKTLEPLSPIGKVLGSLFQSVTTRTDGSNTLPIGDLTQPSLFVIILLMFIGAAPGSTAGGIKITTFAVLLATVWSQINGRADVVLFKRRVVIETVLKAFTVTFIGCVFVISMTILLSITENGHNFIVYLFEVTSALSTVGLSMGLTPELSSIGRLLIIFTMFAGRLGLLTVVFAITKRRRPNAFHHLKGKIMIG